MSVNSVRDEHRLLKAERAMDLIPFDLPQTEEEIRSQMEEIHAAMVALQSLDDLGSPEENRNAIGNASRLEARYIELSQLLPPKPQPDFDGQIDVDVDGVGKIKCELLRSWLNDLVRYCGHVVVECLTYCDSGYRVSMETQKMRYTIDAKPGLELNGIVWEKSPREGETWLRRSALHGGCYSEKTWCRLMSMIVAYEIERRKFTGRVTKCVFCGGCFDDRGILRNGSEPESICVCEFCRMRRRIS